MRRTFYRLLAAVILVVSFGAAAVWAEGASLSQGYQANTQITPGSLVAIEKGNKTIAAATVDQTDNLLGVAVTLDQSLIALSNTATDVQVATSGIAQTLVSTVSGDIKSGDKITISPLAGVGMKAIGTTKVVGTAQADFSASSPDRQEVEVTTKTGTTQKVQVGRIPVLIEVGYYATKPSSETIVPAALQKVFDSVARKSVSVVRVIISLILLVLALVISTVLIYSAARNGIISIGRNPLSQPAIRRSLFQVISIAAGILLVTLISIYLIVSR